MARISMTVNGKVRAGDVEPRLLLVHFLREQSASHRHARRLRHHASAAPARCCVDGRSAKSCTMFAVQADGSTITTIEGLAPDGQLHPLQEGFWEEHGLQCGYCTPGMIMAAVTLLNDNPKPTEREIREGISGNFCRCTGYQHIVNAIQHAAQTEELSRWRPLPCLPKLVGARIKRREDPRLIQGRAHLRRRRRAGRHAAHGVQAQRRRARTHPLDRHQRREGDGGRRSGVHRRGDRGVPGADADRHAVPVAAIIAPSPSDTVRYAGEPVAVVVAADRYLARDAADAIVVSYDTLPAVVDLELAMTGKPTVIHRTSRTTWRWRWCRAAPA